MLDDHAACYDALSARDRRFDGRLYVGVTSTGIYCRPICPARTPRSAHCRFFGTAAAAEAAGFRPCLRCRPELAPGRASVDAASALAWRLARRLEDGELEPGGLPELARRLGVSDRHLRRVFTRELGVPPIAYAQTQRLLMAKRLVADTTLPMIEVALASGFASVRRFNAVFRTHYGMSPSELRRVGGGPAVDRGALRFELAYRPPFDWDGLLGFLGPRTVDGVEQVADGRWTTTVRVGHVGGVARGWVRVGHLRSRSSLEVEVAGSLARVLPQVLARVRRVFDLSCEPQVVAAALGDLAAAAPGLRVPGACDGFQMAVTAILGQQVTVAAARTLVGRLARAFGEPVQTPWAGLELCFPRPESVAAASVDELASLGIIRQRVAALRGLASAVASGGIELSPSVDIGATVQRLRDLPGVGPWTAQYVALRALAWPDAWPSGDVALMKALGAGSRREADALAERWRPWRGYAALQLWRRLSEGER